MTRLPEGKTRLDLVRAGLANSASGAKKRGRMVVSIDRLLEDPKNERKTFRNLDGLIASVRAVGLIEPITVTPEGEGGYRIVTGHRRCRAAKAAGLKEVEVLIREPEEGLMRRIKSIVSNVQREDVGPVEMAEALQSLLDEDETIKTQDDLAKLIGKDKTWVSGMLRILSLPVELQRKVGASQLSVGYDSMIRVARLDDADQQRELIEAILGGATMRDVRERIQSIKGQTGGGGRAEGSKPKKVFHTKYKATVIVQAMGRTLTPDQVLDALGEALGQATNSN